MGGAPPLLAMNGRVYTVLHVHNESSASGQAPEEEGPDGLSSGSPLPMGFHSSSTPRSWFSYRVWERPHNYLKANLNQLTV